MARRRQCVIEIPLDTLFPQHLGGTVLLTGGQDSVWGCNLFLTTQNLKVLDTGTALEGYKDVNTLSGGVAVRDQVQLCSKVRGSTFPTTANLGRKADKAADPPPSPPEGRCYRWFRATPAASF